MTQREKTLKYMENGKEEINGSEAATEKNVPGTETQGAKLEQGGTNLGGAPRIPTLDEVRGWTTRDIEAALYFLSYLRESPSIIDQLSRIMMQEAERGSLIDTVKDNG